MPKIRLLLTPGTKGSQSAKRLAGSLTKKLGYKVWRSTITKANRVNLSYGQGTDKLTQYKWFQEQGIPALTFTTDPEKAQEWVQNGHVLFARTLLNSSCGRGIVIIDEAPVRDYPVYTVYKKKKREFRVHVFKDKVVKVSEKKRRKEWNGERDSKIRNLDNGYVFCHCENEPEGIRELAVKAAACVGSSFRGVDIGYNERNNELFVIEVNSAPGMEGQTLEAYTNAIMGGN